LVEAAPGGLVSRLAFESVVVSDLGKCLKRAAGGGTGEIVERVASVFGVETGGRARGVQSIPSTVPSTKSIDLTNSLRFVVTPSFGCASVENLLTFCSTRPPANFDQLLESAAASIGSWSERELEEDSTGEPGPG